MRCSRSFLTGHTPAALPLPTGARPAAGRMFSARLRHSGHEARTALPNWWPIPKCDGPCLLGSGKSRLRKLRNRLTWPPAARPPRRRQHVQRVYDAIAWQWHGTRYKAWPRVVEFVAALPPASIVADLGCGNGKLFPYYCSRPTDSELHPTYPT